MGWAAFIFLVVLGLAVYLGYDFGYDHGYGKANEAWVDATRSRNADHRESLKRLSEAFTDTLVIYRDSLTLYRLEHDSLSLQHLTLRSQLDSTETILRDSSLSLLSNMASNHFKQANLEINGTEPSLSILLPDTTIHVQMQRDIYGLFLEEARIDVRKNLMRHYYLLFLTYLFIGIIVGFASHRIATTLKKSKVK